MKTKNLILVLVLIAAIAAGICFAALAFADGALDPISGTGVAAGWAVDAKFPTGKESVWIYDKAKASGGKLLGIVQATLPSPDIPGQGAHRFTYALPLSMKDGALHTIFAYRAGSELLAIPRDFTFGARPALTLSSNALTFGNQTVGTTGTSQTLTISNSGTQALQIISIVTTGDFSVSSQCSGGLPVGQSCTVTAMFAPVSAGNRAGLITIESNAPGSPHQVALSGVGVAVAATIPTVELYHDLLANNEEISLKVDTAIYPSVVVLLNDTIIFTAGTVFTPKVFVVPAGFPCVCGVLTQIDNQAKTMAFKVAIPTEFYSKFKISINGAAIFTK